MAKESFSTSKILFVKSNFVYLALFLKIQRGFFFQSVIFLLPFPPECQSQHTAWCCQQPCWGCAQSHSPCHRQRCSTVPAPIQPLGNASCHWSPPVCWAMGHNSLSVTIQPIFYSPSDLSVKSMLFQFRDTDASLLSLEEEILEY